jgi:hypothetical protein
MLNLITALCGDVQQFVRGGTNTARLIQENKEAFATFKDSIKRTAPNFVPFVDAHHRRKTPFENSLDSDQDEGHAEDLAGEGDPFYLEDMQRHIKKFLTPFDIMTPNTDVHLRSITRELPNSVPFDAKLTLIKEFQRNWKNSVHICFVTVREATVKMLGECIAEKCKQYQSLYIYIRCVAFYLTIVNANVRSRSFQTKQVVRR